jgi:hypothetical protein
LGTLGIDPAQAVPFPLLIIPQPDGVGTVSFLVPNVPSLAACYPEMQPSPSGVELANSDASMTND